MRKLYRILGEFCLKDTTRKWVFRAKFLKELICYWLLSLDFETGGYMTFRRAGRKIFEVVGNVGSPSPKPKLPNQTYRTTQFLSSM
jgi:hypothetical protein